MTVRLSLKVRAGAKKTQVVGRIADVWKVQIAAPPVDGKANQEIVRYLAKLCGVPRSQVSVVSGMTNTLKLIQIEGISAEQWDRVILEAHGPQPDSGRTTAPED